MSLCRPHALNSTIFTSQLLLPHSSLLSTSSKSAIKIVKNCTHSWLSFWSKVFQLPYFHLSFYFLSPCVSSLVLSIKLLPARSFLIASHNLSLLIEQRQKYVLFRLFSSHLILFYTAHVVNGVSAFSETCLLVTYGEWTNFSSPFQTFITRLRLPLHIYPKALFGDPIYSHRNLTFL